MSITPEQASSRCYRRRPQDAGYIIDLEGDEIKSIAGMDEEMATRLIAADRPKSLWATKSNRPGASLIDKAPIAGC